MKKLFGWIICILAITFSGCKKEGSYFPKTYEEENTSDVYSFSKIEVIPDSIAVGEFADVIATATGKNLTYTWWTSHGDLFGSGFHIQAGAQPCCVGINQIKCTVSDGQHSETKTVLFTVTF